MKVLLLAPQPFYKERGTPIAVKLILQVLSERGDEVDVVTYHEGRDVAFRHVTLHRIIKVPFVSDIRPGFSWKKLVCDVFVLFKSAWLARKNNYDFTHAVEESVFIAMILKWIFKIPYVYDMDSSLALQMVEKYPCLGPFRSLLQRSERLAVDNAIGVAPVCEALATLILTYKPKKVVVLNDISELPHSDKRTTQE